MNTDTGRTYFLGADFDPEVIAPAIGPGAAAAFDGFAADDTRAGLVASRIANLERKLTEDEVAAVMDMAKGQRVVAVSGDVVQKLQLGERELERRAKRRKATKAAHRRNR